MDNRPIGVFDSGLGGLTVVRQLMHQLPGEDIVYFGDTGRVPYGTRSPQTIERYTKQDCRFLMSEQVKYIIAACGTVSSVASHVLKSLPVAATGVVEPSADAAIKSTRNGKIGVIGTAATINSGSFRRRIMQINPEIQVFEKACPLFVPLVENGWIDRNDDITRLTVERYLNPLGKQGIDTLLLGCTHFPLLASVIGDVLGGNVTLIDSGHATAAACAELLAESGLLGDPSPKGRARFYVSDRPEDFTRVADMFLGCEVDDDIMTVDIEKVDIPETALIKG
ncbi:MAG: glutamate racemase [Oscillospiraceae bacterium]|nr:glutamate racemase [Oscillospiraceae bacterium]MDD4413058.1 glutamate racemase [Oscillospiraceae bacterium]